MAEVYDFNVVPLTPLLKASLRKRSNESVVKGNNFSINIVSQNCVNLIQTRVYACIVQGLRPLEIKKAAVLLAASRLDGPVSEV